MESNKADNQALSDKKLRRHIMLNPIYKGISMVISLVYVPVFLACLGDEKYGVWVTISSVLSWLTSFDIGIGNGLRNRLAEYYAKGEEEKAQSIVSTSYCALGMISMAMFAVFCVLVYAFDLPEFLGLNLDSEPISIVLVMAAAGVCINFVLGLCSTIFYAIQESSVVALKGILVQVGQLGVALFLVWISKSSLLWVAILYASAEIVVNVAFSIYIFARKRYLRPKVSLYNRADARNVTSVGIQFFILQICSLLIYSTDNMIITKFIGPSEVTPYSVVHNAFTIIIAVHASLNLPMWSAYTAANATNDLDWIKRNMRKVLLVTLVLSAGTLVAVPLFKPLARIWLQKELAYASGIIMLEAVYTILSMMSNSYSSVLSGVNYVKKTVVISVIQAIINIPLSIFFVTAMDMGIVGVKIGSVISIAMSAITNPIWVHEWFRKRKEGLNAAK
ncbi:MAG: oligosaccharide flippase family protein [Lachnospiraceae bacterium]|nr:oligosaccharide flippase family protein [Lachnospiraceae bacterium]